LSAKRIETTGRAGLQLPWQQSTPSPNTEMNISETDENLVSRCQAGDNTAFDQLVYKYQELVFRLAYRIVGGNADVEEIAQEVFLRAYRGIKKFRGDAAFPTWLTRIAVNYCIKTLNGRKSRILFEGLTSLINLSREATQHSGMEREEHRAMIRRALERLPPKHKAVIVLRYFEERTCEEIAEILECSVGTVKSRLYHARQKLKELLTPYFEYGREVNGRWKAEGERRKDTVVRRETYSPLPLE